MDHTSSARRPARRGHPGAGDSPQERIARVLAGERPRRMPQDGTVPGTTGGSSGLEGAHGPAAPGGIGGTGRPGRYGGWVPDGTRSPEPAASQAIDDDAGPEDDEAEETPALRPRVLIGVAAALGVLVLALLGTVVYLMLFRPAPEVLPLPAPAQGTAEVQDDPAGQEAGGRQDGHGGAAAVLVVHVAGAVEDPRLVELPSGARVAEAIEAAGGLREDADPAGVNLAREVVDGEQILVPSRDEDGSAGEERQGTAGTGGAAGTVNINTADETALQQLPGVGPSTAAKIVAHRQEHGPFRTVDDLQDVSGIGPKTVEDLRALATV
ncbi:ComEA family DNA-binding protein [Sediminivirga luteola]|uniref:Helix-hairpin-helix DNA-binding motif class 1 domain-containing protein n=1 Tax=Sediminivirga luteola TaxID=1774748 RepID=A0A8J2XKW9_9MICO|nr:ComEA family DNA-binding protein [Sediminivirga luteola]GGA17312.1 hypothetical protein GCM10011333_20510 [Sediminivirga luteola]